MDANIRGDLDAYSNDISDAMGVIEIIRRGVLEANDEVEIVAWKSLADVGLVHCVEELNGVAMGLNKLCEDQKENYFHTQAKQERGMS